VVSDGTRQAVSNSLGEYNISNVPSDSYTLTATKAGHAISLTSGTNPLDVSLSSLADVDFTAVPALTSPVYSFWNGFLDMINILELVNNGSEYLSVAVSFYDSSGSINGDRRNINIAPGSQFDLILNSLEGFTVSAYGTVCVS